MRVGHVTPFLAAGAAARFNNLAARDIISVGPNGLCCPAGVTVEVFPAYYSTVFNYGTEIDVFQCGTIKTIHKEQCPYTVVTSTYITSTVTGTLPPGCPTAPVSPTSISTSTSTTSASTTITSSATLTTSTATTTIAPGAQFYLSYTGFPVAKRDVVEEKRQFLPGQTAVPIVVIDGIAGPAPTANVVPPNRCNEASLLTLVNGQLSLAGTNNVIAKQSGSLQAALGYLINVAPNAVNTTFAFNGNVLSWIAPDVGNANFFACPNGIQVGFPTFAGDGCVPVQLVAVAQNACSPSSTTSTSSSTSTSTSSSTSSSVTSTSSGSSSISSSSSSSSGSSSTTTPGSNTVGPTSVSTTVISSTTITLTPSSSSTTTTPGSNTVGPTSISTTVISSTTITISPSSSSTITSTISSIATTTTASTISTTSTACLLPNLPAACQNFQLVTNQVDLLAQAATCSAAVLTTLQVTVLPTSLSCLLSTNILLGTTGQSLEQCLLNSGLFCAGSIITTLPTTTATSTSLLPITIPTCLSALPATCQAILNGGVTGLLNTVPCTAELTADVTNNLLTQAPVTAAIACVNTALGVLLPNAGTITTLGNCLTNALVCGTINPPTSTSASTTTSLLPITIPTCLNALPATCQAILTGGVTGLLNTVPCTAELTADVTNNLLTQAPVTAAIACVNTALGVLLPNAGTITTLGNCLTNALVCGTVIQPTTTAGPTTTTSLPVVLPTTSVVPTVPVCLNALPATCQAIINNGVAGLLNTVPCTAELAADVTSGLIQQGPVTVAVACVNAALAVLIPSAATISTLNTCLNNAIVCPT